MRAAMAYLGALIALPLIVVGMAIVAPFLLATVALERLGLKMAPDRPGCGCVRCAQRAKRVTSAAGAAVVRPDLAGKTRRVPV